jgi:imidazolonepropionase-like amidohydrolase
MKSYLAIILSFCLVLTACANPTSTPTSFKTSASLVLTNATLIDGTGADPLPDATLVIGDGRILARGPSSQVTIPAGVELIDLGGAYILPGFINAHVHDAYDESRLEAWAQAGVTTVRDEGIISGSGQLTRLITLRDEWADSPRYARLVSAGYMLSVPGGYGQLDVTSADDARQQVNLELDTGVDLIKLAMESGYAGVTNLPNFSSDELSAIVTAAHDRGTLVTAHITDVRYLTQLLEAGVDDLAHIPTGYILQAQIQQLIEQDIYIVTTLTVFEAYGALRDASYNLSKFVESGVQIALGNDYTFIPQNGFDHFDLGMPMHEITRMNEAGMTPMQIIIASTRNAAHVCGLEKDLGTLEIGKLADILVVSTNLLQDLSALTQVQMVIHAGEIIRQ